MKHFGWIFGAGILLLVVVLIAYRGGYQTGNDMAERDNRLETAD